MTGPARRPAPIRRLGPVLAVLLAACTPAADPPDAARLPPGSFGLGANADQAAVSIVQSDWADTGRTYGHTAEGARAVALLDYLAGDLATGPNSAGIPPGIRQGLLQARREARQAVGIAPDARSQAVVDRLAQVFAAPDGRAALAALDAPLFTVGPRATLQRLGNLPYLQAADVAATRAEQAMSGVGPNETE